jgi:hypothetical protein
VSVARSASSSPNVTPLSADGQTVAFATPTALLGADQNTAGAGQPPVRGRDAYEWRDGRPLLLTDGLTDWSGENAAPEVMGMNPSARDILIEGAEQYTPDALDDYKRLYDARIGGGIEFPALPKPCPLEVCQGTPKGAPEEEQPGSAFFAGLGNASRHPASRCPKGRRKMRRHGKTRCVGRRPHRPHHKRRNAR